MKRFVLFLFFAACQVSAQDARQLLREVNTKFASVKDYQVNVHIRADIPFVRMMPVNAVLYYKQPDKFRIRSKGIALLPRQGFDQLIKSLKDTAAYMPVVQSPDMLRNAKVLVVNILPLSDTSDLILGKLWIDPGQKLILRSQVTSRTNGTVTSDFYFGTHASQALPDSMLFTVDTKKFKVPKAVAADLNNVKSTEPTNKTDKQKGQIFIRFADYSINKGVQDAVFK
jgi:hypothetical protein